MDALILAGGLGTRLRSVVSDVPKCMAPVCGKPFLYYLFTYLKKSNVIERIILSVGYKHEVIKDWIDTQKEFSFEFIFSVEDEPLGTGGAIKNAIKLVKSQELLILNGDTFFNVDIDDLIQSHKNSNATLSIALKPIGNFNRYGNVVINDNNIITDFQEKTDCKSGQINGGVYLLNSNSTIMDGLPNKFSFETDVLQSNVFKIKLYGFIHNGYFIDIGIPEDYEKANNEFKTLF